MGKQHTDHNISKRFQKIWSDEDEILLIEAAVEYKKDTGRDPRPNFNDFKKSKLQSFNAYTEVQLREKLRRIQKNFRYKKPSNSHQESIWKFCELIWPDQSSHHTKEDTCVSSDILVGTSLVEFLVSSANMIKYDYLFTFPPLSEKVEGNIEVQKQLKEPFQKSTDIMCDHRQLVIEALNTNPVNELELYLTSLKLKKMHKEHMMEVLKIMVSASDNCNDGLKVFSSSPASSDGEEENISNPTKSTKDAKTFEVGISDQGNDIAEHVQKLASDMIFGALSDSLEPLADEQAENGPKLKKRKIGSEGERLNECKESKQVDMGKNLQATMEENKVATSICQPEKKHKKKKTKIEDDRSISKLEADRLVNEISDGLTIEVLAKGEANGTVATQGRWVRVHYTGMLRENGHVFSSNVGKSPHKFCLGDTRVIDGWNIGLEGMRDGEKRRLTIPPTKGYGSEGNRDIVPPNSWLVYDIELVEVVS